ncbi:MAG: putative Ig domain-containing protein [Blastocatellia bacterium]
MTSTVKQHHRLLLALLCIALPAGLLFSLTRGKTMNWLSGSATDLKLARASQPRLARSVSAVPAAPAQGGGGFNIMQAVISGGGGVSAGGSYAVAGSVGQIGAGELSGGGFTLSGGFWSGAGSGCAAITVNPASLPGGAQGAAYNQTITATGGTAPYSFAVTSGALPPGLTLSAGGVISGTPAASGTFNFTALATDANNCTGARDYSLSVNASAPVYEADVMPRPDGNGQVTVSDWVQVGRFVAGVDVPAEGGEFQRADCAPRDSLGNGSVTVADWVQAGRYAAGLDQLAPAGGPTKQAMAATFETANYAPANYVNDAATRGLRIGAATFQRGQVGDLRIEMDAQGDENAASFTLNYDPALLGFVEAVLSEELNEAQLLVNPAREANGKIGVLFTLPPGRTMRAGTVQALALRFIAQGGANDVTAKIGFGDQIVKREVTDALANALTGTAFSDGAALITGNAVANVSAADYGGPALAAESIVVAFGEELATAVEAAETPRLPTTLAGATVKVKDSREVERLAPLFFVSPRLINYQIPAGTAEGIATVTITGANGAVNAGLIQVVTTRPGLFSADSSGSGLAAAYAVRMKPDGTQFFEAIIRFDPATNRFIPALIDLSSESDQVILALFGTGLRNRQSLTDVKVTVGGVDCPVQYAGAQRGFAGLDQVNVLLPRSLAGRGDVNVVLTVDDRPSNAVAISIR